MKLDLKQAFRHIPVCPVDWHLLGISWKQKLYYDIVLAFGLCSAPYIFNLFAEALHWTIQQHMPAKLCHYLDNFLGIFLPHLSQNLVSKALDWCLALGAAQSLLSGFQS